MVNHGCKISPDTCSYNLRIGRDRVKVQVLLYKKAFEMYASPPATAECKSSVKANGNLWIGWHGDIKNAWRIVLGVLGIREDGSPMLENPDNTSSSKTACPTVAQNVCDGSSSYSSSFLPSSTIGMERHELEAARNVLKDRLLRSEMCKRPAGTDKADNLIVEEVMRCVEIESQNVLVAAEQAATDTFELAGRTRPG